MHSHLDKNPAASCRCKRIATAASLAHCRTGPQLLARMPCHKGDIRQVLLGRLLTEEGGEG